MGKDKDPALPEDADASILAPETMESFNEAMLAAEAVALDLAHRMRQIQALRGAMTMTCWSGVCAALPEAEDWFDDEGHLR